MLQFMESFKSYLSTMEKSIVTPAMVYTHNSGICGTEFLSFESSGSNCNFCVSVGGLTYSCSPSNRSRLSRTVEQGTTAKAREQSCGP